MITQILDAHAHVGLVVFRIGEVGAQRHQIAEPDIRCAVRGVAGATGGACQAEGVGRASAVKRPGCPDRLDDLGEHRKIGLGIGGGERVDKQRSEIRRVTADPAIERK